MASASVCPEAEYAEGAVLLVFDETWVLDSGKGVKRLVLGRNECDMALSVSDW